MPGSEEALARILEAVEDYDPGELEGLVRELLEARGALARLARLAKRLEETGLLDLAEAIVDNAEDLVLEAARPEVLRGLANLLALARALADTPPEALERLAQQLPELARLAGGD